MGGAQLLGRKSEDLGHTHTDVKSLVSMTMALVFFWRDWKADPHCTSQRQDTAPQSTSKVAGMITCHEQDIEGLIKVLEGVVH